MVKVLMDRLIIDGLADVGEQGRDRTDRESAVGHVLEILE